MYDGNDVLLLVVIMVDVVIPLTSRSMVGDEMDRSILLVAALAGTNQLTIHLMVISNWTLHTRCWQTVVRYNALPDPTTMSEAV
jgi:predicted N-acyltransferase